MSGKVINNKILLGLMREFEEDYGLPKLDEAKSFERFANYVILSKIDPEAFSDPATFDLIDVDKDGTFGIDGFSLFVNDSIIADRSDIEVHRKLKRMDVRFVFIQSKRSSSIDAGELLKFSAAVRNIFAESPSVPLSEDLRRAKDLIDEIFQYENAKLFAGRKPRCELYFATAGGAIADDVLLGLVDSEERNIASSVQELRSVSIRHMDADRLIDAYNEIENRYSVVIDFDRNLPCVKITDVEQAFIGYLHVSEFLKIITGSDSSIRKNIFYENVRDFQGMDNSVNSEIAGTLSDDDMIDKFIILNNGVTVVAGNFSNIRSTEYEISDYFIVNGCQTSNVIFKFRDRISGNSNLHVPIKIIHTTSNDLIAKLIRSTNRQTPVPDEAFVSLEKFHKRLQEFYRIYSVTAPEPLFYERRSKEFTNGDQKIEKSRIINLHSQIRSFTSIMLGEPHLVMSQNPSSILKEHGDKIFRDDHKHTAYYLSSLIVFLFNRYTSLGMIDRKHVTCRFWICWIARIIVFGKINVGPFNSHRVDADCEAVIRWLSSEKNSVRLLAKAAEMYDTFKSGYISRNGPTRGDELVRLRAFRDEVKARLSSEISSAKCESSIV